jgi:katanin p60 ATPase-containing subunit A1
MSANNYKLADNIDLMKILIEFESYHQLKYGRKVKLLKEGRADEVDLRSKNATKCASKARAPTSRAHARSSLSSSALPPMKPAITCLPPLPFVTNSSSPTPSPSPPSLKKPETGKEASQSLRSGASESGSMPDSPQMEISGVSYSSNSAHEPSFAETNIPSEEVPYSSSQFQHLLSLPPSLSSGQYAELAAVISRDVIMNVADTHWDDVIALDSAKQLLTEALVLPLQFPQLFTGLLTPWKGVLLYGPPGL